MAKRRRKRSAKVERRKASARPRLPLVIGILVVAVGLIGFGFRQWQQGQAAQAAGASLSGNSSEVTSLDAAQTNRASGAHTTSADDALARYLGPETNPDGLAQAERGTVDQPTLVWFHADWCHVCQQIKPEVAALGETYEGQVHFVRLNVDHPDARGALRQYRVRATPTFVLIDADGQIRANVPGWPGSDQVANAFDQLLAGG
jgi:thioredoxin-like negative regulator of GroEL